MGHADASVSFSDWLRGQLKTQDLGVRTLARRIDPQNPDVPRRALNRYLAGANPQRENAERIALALGVPLESIPRKEARPLAETFRGGPGGGFAAGDRPGGGEGDGGGSVTPHHREV